MDFKELYQVAKSVVNPRRLSHDVEAGSVGAAILTNYGNVYTGVCIDTACSMGFCAEHAAIAAMVTNGESKIIKIIAVDYEGNILPPCGRCREFINQLDDANTATKIKVSQDTVVTLKELLPFDWRDL